MSEIIRTSQLPNWEGGAPGPHELSTLDGLRAYQDPAHEEFLEAADTILSKWQGDQFVGLYLYGNPGTGKTHAAIGLGRALHDSGAEVHYRFGPSNTYRTVESQLDNLTANRLHESTRGVTFPQNFKSGAPRNPRSVLIFDEYQPQNQAALKGSITAAAQYGGLIVITSNYKDPFKPLEV
ncbi:MAG TPA: ATP-binding protein, partial [Candidatus Saccharimonadales bacterium]|nr:ATP-binding protein [Candidatus Saccharimonadales bacterium]